MEEKMIQIRFLFLILFQLFLYDLTMFKHIP